MLQDSERGMLDVLTFNNRDVEVWKALIDALINAGFSIENATYQVPAVVPAKPTVQIWERCRRHYR